ncbi:uncharacterized protein LOC109544195 isoform X1 [Dendroctonus ponderosae]|uniref:uncharacterized protein LOC109544195 isoform X1 n=1 Tax=Dendroctonus ponderosae TaxID=77166 RepID=UPI002034BC47|nr:uncharacterized protein LOC109544195 isoform X1 [Dendroctonus ponderosae]
MWSGLFRNIVLIFLIHHSISEGNDLLHLFRPKPDLPRELNDFLTDVQEHQRDFAFIRNAARNQHKYEKSFEESHDLLGEDIGNQLTINPDYNRKVELDQVRPPYAGVDNSIYAGFEAPQKFKYLYPEKRYSKFVRSPIRLRRELEDSFLTGPVQADSNGDYGSVQRPEPKLPANQLRADQNRYHTGFLVGVEDRSDQKDHPDAQRKREVEISIKSDGKLIKRIEETEDAPKTILLNIKASNPSNLNQAEASLQPTSSSEAAPTQEKLGTNSDSIPSPNQNKDIGVPINAIPAVNGLNAHSKAIASASLLSKEDANRISNSPVVSEPEKEPLNLPEVEKAEDFKTKFEPYGRADGWSADNLHMAKSIDLAQGNINGNFEAPKDKPSLDFGLNDEKKQEFDKVQGLLVDASSNPKPKEKRKRRFEDVWGPPQMYEVHERSTKDILVVPIGTTECPKARQEEEAEEIGDAIAKQIIKEEEEENNVGVTPAEEEDFEIVRHPKATTECVDCRETPPEEEVIIHENHHRGRRRSGRKRSRKHHNHHRPDANHKKKKAHHHQKKQRTERESLGDYYDVNLRYGGPEDAFDYLPSYKRRSLKSWAYEFDPHLIPDVGNKEEEAAQRSNNVRTQGVKKNASNRKKCKSDGDYSDEEDSMTVSPPKRLPIKKTQNRLAFDSATTTEDNDDDYDYSDLTDIEDEDEDIAYEEVRGDNLEMEDAVENSSRNEHENDKLRENLQRELKPLLAQLEASTAGTEQSVSSGDVGDMLLEAHRVLANAHGHGASRKKSDKRQRKPNHIGEESATARKRRKRRHSKHLHKHPTGKEVDEKRLNSAVAKRSPAAAPLQEKPLTPEQKQEIFLRYNPEFQRWPRFIQNDNQYQALMRKRALDNQRRHFRTVRNGNNFPISNEYFLDSRPEFVKRQEPSTAEAEAAAASEISTEADASSETASAAEAADATAPSAAAEELSTAAADAAAAASATSAAMESESTSTANQLQMAVQATATLPESARNILQTANSDIFENTTVPGIGAFGETNFSPAQTVQPSTEFQFTTKVEDLTTNTQCENVTQKRVESCDEESAKHSPSPITSVLPLLPDAASEMAPNMTKDQFLDLDEILVGVLPRTIVAESLANAHGSVRMGLRAGRFNMNMLLSGFNNSAETSLILSEMTNLLKKLKYRSTCQILPANLKTYVKILTKNEMDDPMMKLKEMNEIDFDEHQSNYVFHTGQNDNIQEKAGVLKELLNKYDNLPADCKERAEPVKEYIETHLAMIERMGEKGETNGAPATGAPTSPPLEPNSSSVKPKSKKEIGASLSEDAAEVLDGQLIEEGMDNQKANANEMIDGLQSEKSKRQAFDLREISTSTSPQFGNLAHAVRNIRNRREVMKRIGQIYGQRGSRAPPRSEERGFEAPRLIDF